MEKWNENPNENTRQQAQTRRDYLDIYMAYRILYGRAYGVSNSGVVGMNNIVKKEETALVQTPTPMDMIQMAVQQGADPDQLSKLMDLQERWEAKEAKKAFLVAKAIFKKECPPIYKITDGHNCKYAKLDYVIDTIGPIMEKCEFDYSWKTSNTGPDVTVECIVTHIKGHSESSELTAGADTSGKKQVVQGVGSTVSYFERYTLLAVMGITTRDMDNNGEGSNITSEQKKEIINLIKETNSNTTEFLNYAGIKSVDEMPAHKFDRAISILKNRKKK